MRSFMVNDSFFEKPKKKDTFEQLPLYIDIPMPELEELSPKEEQKEERGVIIIELF